jgi:hypothetical protein
LKSVKNPPKAIEKLMKANQISFSGSLGPTIH